ncbi:hypothetical protein LJC56_06900 [Christensenellaceae bacterium OttesenSCG-928-K19]|nr:hypothetical protein [Christensenellaceae bacterium OttesenSCG-928-K19]
MASFTKNKEVMKLNKAMTLEEIEQILCERLDTEKFQFKLKKGIMGKGIEFETVMQILPRLTVKGDEVRILRVTSKTTVSVGGSPGMDFKAMGQFSNAIKDGGIKGALTGGQSYFESVCDAVREALSAVTK